MMDDKNLEVARASATLIAEGLAGNIPPSMDQVKMMAKAIVVFIDENQSLRARVAELENELAECRVINNLLTARIEEMDIQVAELEKELKSYRHEALCKKEMK